jgi:hypothetical protein
MSTTPRCPRCKSEALTLSSTAVLVWDGQAWIFEGEFGDRRWLTCADCGHSWRTKRDLYETSQALAR